LWAGPVLRDSEAGDVQFGLAQDGADAADDARDILVADDDQGSGQLGLDVDAIVAEQARRLAVEDGGKTCPGAALVMAAGCLARPMKGKAERRACAAGDLLALVFLDADAALGGRCGGVDAVDAVGPVKDAGDGGVADHVRLEGGEAAVVGERDAFYVSQRGVGDAGAAGVAE